MYNRCYGGAITGPKMFTSSFVGHLSNIRTADFDLVRSVFGGLIFFLIGLMQLMLYVAITVTKVIANVLK